MKNPYKKKLIEVALPLDAINVASAAEKSIRQGHPSTIHLWWARRPLSACRSVLAAQLLDDPSAHPEQFKTKESQDKERVRLMNLIRDCAPWASTKVPSKMNALREELKKSGASDVCIFDPFSGGGSIPLEAVRLGLSTIGNDLNPVAALISRATAAVPAKIFNAAPKHPRVPARTAYTGLSGLVEDLKCFSEDVLDEAKNRLAANYGTVHVPGEGDMSPIAWIWIRTVTSPNPAFSGVIVPLLRTNFICTKEGNKAWVVPSFDQATRKVILTVHCERDGIPVPNVEKFAEGQNFTDFAAGGKIPEAYLREQANSKGLGYMPLAVVVAAGRGRKYLSCADVDMPIIPESNFLMDFPAPLISGYFNPPLWGHKSFGSLFNSRQRFALETFASIIREFKDRILDVTKDSDYAALIQLYLTLGLGRLANRLSSFCIWNPEGETIEQTFSEQGVGMVWDFAEANPLGNSTGSWAKSFEYIFKVVEQLPVGDARILNQNAAKVSLNTQKPVVVSTDPPYFSSITYSDFADFFYLPFRSALRDTFPDYFGTITSPKEEEAVAAWHRFGGDKAKASNHFKVQLGAALKNSVNQADPQYPLAIYYAFKSTEVAKGAEGVATAWESILEIILSSGLQVVRTWPIRTERISGRKADKNVLASSIIIVCRKRNASSKRASQKEFLSELRTILPDAINELKDQQLSPADLPQSIVGVGMSIFSQFESVTDAADQKLSVRDAIIKINAIAEEFMSTNEAALDSFSQWALLWLQIYGFSDGEYGEAQKISQAKSVDLDVMVERSIVETKRAKTRLVNPFSLNVDELDKQRKDASAWETTVFISLVLNHSGEAEAADRLRELNGAVQPIIEIAYRAYSLCEKHACSKEAALFKALIGSWDEIVRLSKGRATGSQQSFEEPEGGSN